MCVQEVGEIDDRGLGERDPTKGKERKGGEEIFFVSVISDDELNKKKRDLRGNYGNVESVPPHICTHFPLPCIILFSP